MAQIIKDYDWPDIFRQTPGGKGQWDGVRFITDPVGMCDVTIMFNNRMKTDTKVTCARNNIWALMQEPYCRGFSDWMVERHSCFSRVFTHYIPSNDSRYVRSQPANPWHVNRTYDELISMQIPAKSKLLSGIMGDAMDLPGHIKRKRFLEYVRNSTSLNIDMYGKKIHFIPDKWEGLAPYKYSLAMENSSGPDYWTEKVADCFLTWTVPFYYGCTNLKDYFPGDSFIGIDIEKPEESLARIRETLKKDVWERRLPALEEARNLVLTRYQIFPHLAGLIRAHLTKNGIKEEITIPVYRRSTKANIFKAIYKFKKMTGLL